MKAADKVRVILYRIHEKGLEVMLIRPDLHTDENVWKLPKVELKQLDMSTGISLESSENQNAGTAIALALEADWHDLHSIPSVRGIVKHDIKRFGNKLKKVTTENGPDYHGFKDALKKVLPYDNALLQELRDIIVDRNQASLI